MFDKRITHITEECIRFCPFKQQFNVWRTSIVRQHRQRQVNHFGEQRMLNLQIRFEPLKVEILRKIIVELHLHLVRCMYPDRPTDLVIEF